MTNQERLQYTTQRFTELVEANHANRYSPTFEKDAADALLWDSIMQFAFAVYNKAKLAREKYDFHPFGWATPDWQADLQKGIAEHLLKGDPRDVAVYAMFAWFHGWPTAAPAPALLSSSGSAAAGEAGQWLPIYPGCLLPAKNAEWGEWVVLLNNYGEAALEPRFGRLCGDDEGGLFWHLDNQEAWAFENFTHYQLLGKRPTAEATIHRAALAAAPSPVVASEANNLDGLPEGEYHLSDLENRLYHPFGDPGLPLDDKVLLDHVCQYARRLQKKGASSPLVLSSGGGAEVVLTPELRAIGEEEISREIGYRVDTPQMSHTLSLWLSAYRQGYAARALPAVEVEAAGWISADKRLPAHEELVLAEVKGSSTFPHVFKCLLRHLTFSDNVRRWVGVNCASPCTSDVIRWCEIPADHAPAA